MTLPMPKLDDRDFQQLVEEARKLIPQLCPKWTDLSPGDPGIVLLELFAHLTDALIHRLNRVPEKVYVALLRPIGVQLQPPAGAGVTLRFSRSRPGEQLVGVARGTRVKPERSGAGASPTFSTVQAARIEPGSDKVDVQAYDCEWEGGDDGEVAGVGTGRPGQSVQASRAPIALTSAEEPGLYVGVEVAEGEDVAGEIRLAGGRRFRIWQEVDSFANLGDDLHVYTADPMTGVVTFAPAARLVDPDTGELQSAPRPLAEVPRSDRQIRLWYRVGGGSRGNVAANTLRVLRDPVPGVEVTNPEAATGGRDAEELANALVRGPHEFRALQRVVTARDFEQFAGRSHGAVARAKAYTKAAVWPFALPGTVEVLLVPTVPGSRPGDPVTCQQIEAQQTEDAIRRVRAELHRRRPLGTACEVKWTRYKEVAIHATVVARRAENVKALRERILARLRRVISPLPDRPDWGGWPFGETLHVSRAYGIIMSEPGVHHVRGPVRLVVRESADHDVAALASDAFMKGAWHAGSDDRVFRSHNDAAGWELTGQFAEEKITRIRPHPRIAGLVAVLTHRGAERHSRVYLSPDCGESWNVAEPLVDFAFAASDFAWLPDRDGPRAVLATDEGLYEARPGQAPVRVEVERDNPSLAFYAVATTTDPAGRVHVAVAAQESKGVFVRNEGGHTGTFRNIGMAGHDMRALAVQVIGSRRSLWAGRPPSLRKWVRAASAGT